jgi:hypothetical protein
MEHERELGLRLGFVGAVSPCQSARNFAPLLGERPFEQVAVVEALGQQRTRARYRCRCRSAGELGQELGHQRGERSVTSAITAGRAANRARSR